MVPEGWKVCRLDDIADYRRGSFPQPYGLDKWFDDNGYPFVQVYDVDKNLKLKQFTKTKISDLAAEQSVFAPKGTLLVTLQGSIGRVAITQYSAYVDRTLLVIRGLKLPGDNFYLATALQELFAKEKEKAPGGTIKTITKAVLSKFRIFWPPSDEQKKIAKILSTWDQAITATERLLENSRRRKKGLMQQLLTGKKRLPGFEGEWAEARLDELFAFKKGKGLSKSAVVKNGNYKCVLYGELYTKYGEVIREVVSRCDDQDGLVSKKGDILLPSSTTTSGIDLANATAVVEDGILLGGDIIVLRPKSQHDPIFFSHLLTHIKKYEIASRAQGITIIHLYGSDLKDLVVKTPVCNAEQKAISEVMTIADSGIEALSRRLACLKQEKKALMQQLLTGKRRVNVETEAA